MPPTPVPAGDNFDFPSFDYVKHFWRTINLILVAVSAWSGYWAIAPERFDRGGFIQSLIPLGPDYPPIWQSSLVVFAITSLSAFVTLWQASRQHRPFRLPSWDRNPFREVSDPLQAIAAATVLVLVGTLVATLRFLFGSSLGVGAVLFLWSADLGLFLGAFLGFVTFRPAIVVA